MNKRELTFILRFRNEAGRGLKAVGRQLRQAGKAASTAAARGFAALERSLDRVAAKSLLLGKRMAVAGRAMRRSESVV